MPRNATYINRWWKSERQTTLFPGTWHLQRRLGSAKRQLLKLDHKRVLYHEPGSLVAVEQGVEYEWSTIGAAVGAITWHCRCVHCGARSGHGKWKIDLVAPESDPFRVVGFLLEPKWRSWQFKEFNERLADLGILPLCPDCLVNVWNGHDQPLCFVARVANHEISLKDYLRAYAHTYLDQQDR